MKQVQRVLWALMRVGLENSQLNGLQCCAPMLLHSETLFRDALERLYDRTQKLYALD